MRFSKRTSPIASARCFLFRGEAMTSTLSADRPQTDPSQDLFGYAPFAQTLTKALCNYRTSDSLVLGLYGDWGSGKSTILKFICHNLKEVPKDERPIVIEFNPWWFSGQENLARAFLGQLQTILPQKNENFKNLAVLLGNLAEGIGIAIDAAGGTWWGKQVGTFIKKFFNRPTKDIPVIKKEICDILLQTGKHIIIMVDDIDRLEAEEIRQLFTVIKALADFPNVIYLLSFDYTVVVKAIEKYSGMPGQEYLEKIVQVPFTVPHIDRTMIRSSLCTHLNEILKETPDDLFDHGRWNSIFYNGIENIFTVPRDIVRFCNALSVTYPAVCGEVNAADFIAIESIRVFIPNLYRYIWENQDDFISSPFGEKISDHELEEMKQIIPKHLQDSMENVLKVLFPYAYGQSLFFSDSQRMMYISAPSIFNNYFQFTPSPKIISNHEMIQWIDKIEDADEFGAVLLHAREKDLQNVGLYLDKLSIYAKKDIEKNDIHVVINVLLNIGDNIIEPFNNIYGLFVVDNYTIIIDIIYTLIHRLNENERLYVIEYAIKSGNAIAVQCRLLMKFEYEIDNRNKSLITKDELSKLKQLWLTKVDECTSSNSLIYHQNMIRILNGWRKWTVDNSKIKIWCDKVTEKDDGMLEFISKFISKMATSSGRSEAIISYIDIKWMEPYIDVSDFEKRVLALKEQDKIPSKYEEAATLFLQGVKLRREGKSPEDIL